MNMVLNILGVGKALPASSDATGGKRIALDVMQVSSSVANGSQQRLHGIS